MNKVTTISAIALAVGLNACANKDDVALQPEVVYKTEKVALVTLTDGSANSMPTRSGDRMMIKLGNKYHLCHYGWRDEKRDLTYHLLKYLYL